MRSSASTGLVSTRRTDRPNLPGSHRLQIGADQRRFGVGALSQTPMRLGCGSGERARSAPPCLAPLRPRWSCGSPAWPAKARVTTRSPRPLFLTRRTVETHRTPRRPDAPHNLTQVGGGRAGAPWLNLRTLSSVQTHRETTFARPATGALTAALLAARHASTPEHPDQTAGRDERHKRRCRHRPEGWESQSIHGGDADRHPPGDHRQAQAHAPVDQSERVDDLRRPRDQPQRQELVLRRHVPPMDRRRDARSRRPIPQSPGPPRPCHPRGQDRSRLAPPPSSCRSDNRGGRRTSYCVTITTGTAATVNFHDERDNLGRRPGSRAASFAQRNRHERRNRTSALPIGHPCCCLDGRRERASLCLPPGVEGLSWTSPSRRR